MKINIDIKSLLIGFLTAVVILLVMGQATSANRSNFGFAIDRTGMTLVGANDGTVYVVDPQTSRAEIVTYNDGPFRKQAFNLNKSLTKKSAEKRNPVY